MFKSAVVGLTMAAVVAGSLFTATPAKAWWVRGGYWGPHYARYWGPRFYGPRFVYGPRVIVAGPPVYYGVPYRGAWVPAHYTPWGAFVPGHWR